MAKYDKEPRVYDEGNLHRYRTELPNLIDDSGLSVYAFRLYAHFKRVAGDNGRCFQGTRTLAEHTGMSPGKVSDAKQELVLHRFISVMPGRPGTRESDTIVILDIWEQNFRAYGRFPLTGEYSPLHAEPQEENPSARSPHEREIDTVNFSRSPHERETPERVHHMNESTGSRVHHMNTRSNGIKNNPSIKKEQGNDAGAAAAPSAISSGVFSDDMPDEFPRSFHPSTSPFGYFCHKYKERWGISAHITKRDIAARNAAALAKKYGNAEFTGAVDAFFLDERKAERRHLWELFYADFGRYVPINGAAAPERSNGSGGLAGRAAEIEARLNKRQADLFSEEV